MNVRAMLRTHGAAAAAVVLCAVHFAGFRPASQPILTDIRYFLYFAWRVADGAVPHLDYFENKTQLASFVGAALHKLGELLGTDPLMAIRWGYLAIAATGGLIAFGVLRRLGRERAVAGWLGLLAYCSFGLLGVLPAIGNIPKLLMAIGGSVAALLLVRRRWFLAGVVGALAFMDWQVGGLVGLAAVVTAALYGVRRVRAVLHVLAGGVAGLAPFLIYYGLHGGLGHVFDQVIGSSLFRGSATLAAVGPLRRLVRITQVVDLACPAQQWLFYLGLAGMVVAVRWMWKRRRDDMGRLLLPLVIYHFGIVAFSLIDFQYYGDLFLLLHSVAFFLGLAWVALYGLVVDALKESRRPAASIVALVLAIACARPGPLRPSLELVTPVAGPGATLSDQRNVARAVDARLGDRSVAFMEHCELFYLMRRENALPLAYWNFPAWSLHRLSSDEPFLRAGARVLLAADTDSVVPPRLLGYDFLSRHGYVVVPFTSDNGRYSVQVALRSNDAHVLP